MTHPDLSALTPRVCRCGEPTGSVALDTCAQHDPVCSEPSENRAPETVQVDRAKYLALLQLYWTARLLYWTAESENSGYADAVMSLPLDVARVTDAIDVERGRRTYRDGRGVEPTT